MNWIDIALLVVVGLSVFTGFKAGFARTGVGFIATIAAIYFGFRYYSSAGSYVSAYVSSRPFANLIGFLLVFSAIVVAGGIVSRILAQAFDGAGMSSFDRLLGGAFGFVRGGLMAIVIGTALLAFASSPPPQFIVESKTLPYVVEASGALAAATPREVKDAFQDTKDKVKRIWEERLKRKVEKLKPQEV
jgi:membrane protein required for colicin V production